MRPPIPPPASLSESAALLIRLAVAQYGDRELSFRCEWDAARNEVTAPALVFVGKRTTARQPFFQFPRGSVALHTHPGDSAEPSDTDLDTAASLADRGVAFAITTTAADRLFAVTTPPMVTPPLHALDHYLEGRRRWTLGPLALEHTPKLGTVTLSLNY